MISTAATFTAESASDEYRDAGQFSFLKMHAGCTEAVEKRSILCAGLRNYQIVKGKIVPPYDSLRLLRSETEIVDVVKSVANADFGESDREENGSGQDITESLANACR